MLGATIVLIYIGSKTMTKRACDVEPHGGMFQVAPEIIENKANP